MKMESGGMFGIGLAEIVVILLGLVCFAAFIAGVIAVVGLVMRPKEGEVTDRLAQLEAENTRLREEVKELRSRLGA
ncbi:MAG: hypothetical protein KY475_11535 [Planctomycetes bacterium]|nr:hypothetical protein [Planctomycetota bacterium]